MSDTSESLRAMWLMARCEELEKRIAGLERVSVNQHDVVGQLMRENQMLKNQVEESRYWKEKVSELETVNHALVKELEWWIASQNEQEGDNPEPVKGDK